MNTPNVIGRQNGAEILSISFEKYVELEGDNWSSLKPLRRSPAHYRHAKEVGRGDTASLKLGRAVHLAVLEPEKFASRCVLWDGGRRYGKAWDAFCVENYGREILKADEFELCQRISEAVHANPSAHRYLTGGAPEQSIFWTDERTKRRLKGRIDYVSPGTALVDLKTTRDASPSAFGRDFWRLGYHGQFALYMDGYVEVTGDALPFVVIAVESEPPNVVQVYTVPDEVIEAGREEYSALLERLAECEASGTWPGYAETDLELTLPKWALGDSDEDIEELGLVVGGDGAGADASAEPAALTEAPF